MSVGAPSLAALPGLNLVSLSSGLRPRVELSWKDVVNINVHTMMSSLCLASPTLHLPTDTSLTRQILQQKPSNSTTSLSTVCFDLLATLARGSCHLDLYDLLSHPPGHHQDTQWPPSMGTFFSQNRIFHFNCEK